MKTPEPQFTTGHSALLHELVQKPYRDIVRDFTKGAEYFELRQLMLLYVWAVAIATTLFSEVGKLSEEDADAHVSLEADFCAENLLPALKKEFSLEDELLDAEDFLEAYQSALLFLAYRVEEDSDAEDVVSDYFETAHPLDQYENPDQIDEQKFADALFELFAQLGETAVHAAHAHKGLN